MCNKHGVTTKCIIKGCKCMYHPICALLHNCKLVNFSPNGKIFMCEAHGNDLEQYLQPHRADNIIYNQYNLEQLLVNRPIFLSNKDKGIDFNRHEKLRVGTLTIEKWGKIIPKYPYVTECTIYPVGYKANRIYWCWNPHVNSDEGYARRLYTLSVEKENDNLVFKISSKGDKRVITSSTAEDAFKKLKDYVSTCKKLITPKKCVV